MPSQQYIRPGQATLPYGAQQRSAYYAPYLYAPPPKKRTPLVPLLLVIVGLGLFGLFATVAMNLGGTEIVPSPTPTGPVIPTGIPEPDKNPSDLPVPKNLPESRDWVESNALYTESLPQNVQCSLGDVEVADLSESELEDHLNQLTACLWAVWNEPVTNAGFELPRPLVNIYSSEVKTPCGEMESMNAAYCSANQQIYFATDLFEMMDDYIKPGLGEAKFATETVVAHEFGHAIQARTGILYADAYLEHYASSTSEKNDYSRRTEMQADCFAGGWTESVEQANGLTQAQLQVLEQLMYGIGDDQLNQQEGYSTTHGLGKNRQAWYVKGLKISGSPLTTCNTYVA
ncbi:MAG: neutral zinc metallopeptidase, partial [Propionibacteriaceae bacterium]|nr:neutral zinc metallopeptidase [Propionibacteriaceae bacterium]